MRHKLDKRPYFDGKSKPHPTNENNAKNKLGSNNKTCQTKTHSNKAQASHGDASVSRINTYDFMKKKSAAEDSKRDVSEKIFLSNLQTVPVNSCRLQINETNIEKIKARIIAAFEEGPYANFAEKVQRVLQKISEMVKKSHWIEMQDGVAYFCDLDALLPSAENINVVLTQKGGYHDEREPWKYLPNIISNLAEHKIKIITNGKTNDWNTTIYARQEAYECLTKRNLLGGRAANLPTVVELARILDCEQSQYTRHWQKLYEKAPKATHTSFTCLTLKDKSKKMSVENVCCCVYSDGKVNGALDRANSGTNGNEGSASYAEVKFYTLLPLYAELNKVAPENRLNPVFLLLAWVDEGLIPKVLSSCQEYQELVAFIRSHKNLFDGENAENFLSKAKTIELFRSNVTLWNWNIDEILAEILAGKTYAFDKIISSLFASSLLECDLLRSDIHPAYTEKDLTNINRGHWDLWGDNATLPQNTEQEVSVACEFIARNPLFDIKDGGKVGIDFGTKSTTVVCSLAQEKMPRPMRIGNGDYNKLPDSYKDYENPTIIQFIDWRSFVDDYKAKAGRPSTRWADLIISHAALDRLKESEESALFQTFHADLKQWAGGRHIFRLADLQGHKWELHPFVELADDDIDPIEIYAYNVGLFINNMRTGIFLQYELSYPVTYDKDIRDRLRASFERGIRKSLPLSIQNDKEAMRKFYVRFAASEPAAYSLCALQKFGFAPQGEEQYFYGVFDFGGGTSDFDFGVFREANDDEVDEGYDYVLEHFLPSGDKYLGGENILQLLSYEVFKKNKAKLLKEGVTFPHPYEADNTAFAGEEGLVSDAPEAHLNMQLMMEKLRPVWETAAETELSEEFSSGLLKMKLFDKFGEQKTNVELTVETDALREIIKKRINRGVVNFFARLQESFRTALVPENTDKINIFLAGNSCRSAYVKELFEEYIKSYAQNAKAFDLYPPLGSAEGIERMRANGIEIPSDEQELLLLPTGKTGVAFGLIMGSGASPIKIIDKNVDASGKIAFRFYVGRQTKGIFKPVLSIHSPIKGNWERLQSVGTRPVVEIHSSELAEAGTGKLPISKTARITIPIKHPEQTNMGLFIRIHSANEIEYSIANSVEEIIDSSIEIQRLEEA